MVSPISAFRNDLDVHKTSRNNDDDTSNLVLPFEGVSPSMSCVCVFHEPGAHRRLKHLEKKKKEAKPSQANGPNMSKSKGVRRG